MGTESAQDLAAVAARQYGVVTRAQLRALGVGDHGVAERLRTGRLHRLHRGVYAVGHPVVKREGHWMAAVLACGPRAVLSHAAAAALWGVRQSAATLVDVTVPTRAGRRRRPGMRVHRTVRLEPEDITTRERIPVTSLARTLLDLAGTLDARALKRVVDEAEYLRLLDVRAVRKAIERSPGRAGARLAEAIQGPLELTRSVLEERFLALVERHGLPRPLAGARVEGYEVDFHWPEARLVVELDGFAAHGTRGRFEQDRLRDRRLARAGQQTIRLTARALRYEEDGIADELAALVSRSRASSKPSRRSSTSAASAM